MILIKELRIILYEPDLILTLPFGFIVLILILLIKKIIHIRIGFLHFDRLGHFAANTELFIQENNLNLMNKKTKTLDLFYLPTLPHFDPNQRRFVSNTTLLALWKRKLNIYPRFFLRPVCLLIRFFQLNDFRCGITKDQDRDVLNLLDDTECSIDFTKKEIQKGYECLNDFGLNENSKFVCLTVRDNEYLKNIYQQTSNTITSRHQYRNSDINNFLETCEYLTTKGYFVFRMGVKASEQLNTNNPMIIDYARSEMRNDFMDIYLGANCAFCMSTTSGFDSVPTIFRRTIAFITMPVSFFHTWVDNSLIITKHHYSKKKKRKLTLSEISNSGISTLHRTEQYKKHGIELIDNSPEEIRDLALEMLNRLEDGWSDSENDNKLQKKFWKIYLSSDYNKLYRNKLLHGKIRARFGAKYLSNNLDWIQ